MAERFDRYFANAKTWPEEKRLLRAILLDFPLAEELKWRKPCYTYAGGNVAIMMGMKQHCGLGFFKGALIDDPQGLLTKPGENSQASRQFRATSPQDITENEAALRAIIAHAIEIEKSGAKVSFTARQNLTYPDELTEAMADDPELADAFTALTPGRQRGYVLFISDAKQAATRTARIAKHRARILEGKGMHDR